MQPKSILAARNLLYASLFVAILVFILQQFILIRPGHLNITTLVSNGGLLVLLYVAIRYIGFGRKWARTLFLVLFIFNVVAAPIYVPFLLKTNRLLGFLFILQMLLQVPALIYLYSINSNTWFDSFDRMD